MVDTGVTQSLLAEEVWKELKTTKGERVPKLKKNKRHLVPFGKNGQLECVGRSKVKIPIAAGSTVRTMADFIRGVSCSK